MSRATVYIVKLKLDFCANTCGQAPCTWTGEKCYNTFNTCQDKPNYNKSTKEYKFKSETAPNDILLDCLPFLSDVSILPTELKEDQTINARANLTFRDERDFDISTDPYIDTRALKGPAVQGTYFRKLYARNRNYKGRIIEIYEGDKSKTESEFELKFRGKIEKLEFDSDKVKINCLDLLSKLDDSKYPIRLNSLWLEQALPICYIAESFDEMKTLALKPGDIINRKDHTSFELSDFPFEDLTSTITQAVYQSLKQNLVCYTFDSHNRSIAFGKMRSATSPHLPQLIRLSIKFWQAPGSFYHILYDKSSGKHKRIEATTANDLSITIKSLSYLTETGFQAPVEAERYFIYNSGALDDIKSYSNYFGLFEATLNASPEILSKTGYVRIGKEIIQYSDWYDNKLLNIKRNIYNTGPEAHSIYSSLEAVFAESPQNPVSILKRMLNYSGISDEYIDSNAFDIFAENYSGLNVSCLPLVKESKVKELYFDLINIINAQSWINEEGKVTIRDRSETVLISDKIYDSDIVKGSVKVDTNEADRITRVLQSFNRISVDATYKDRKSFDKHCLTIDANAESEIEYNDEILVENQSVWLNNDCGTSEELFSYIKELNGQRLKRRRDGRTLIKLDLDIQKSYLLAGDYIELYTDEIQDETGASISGKTFQIIKREQKENKLTIEAIEDKLAEAGSYAHEEIDDYGDTEVKTSFEIPEDYFVSGIQYFDPLEKIWKIATNNSTLIDIYWGSLLIAWDNEYMSQRSAITLLGGSEIAIPTTEAFKKIDHYDVYVYTAHPKIVAEGGSFLVQNYKPSFNEPNGMWKKYKVIPDIHTTEDGYKYTCEVEGSVGDISAVLVIASTKKSQDKIARVE